MKIKGILCLLICLVLMLGLLSGCGGGSNEQAAETSQLTSAKDNGAPRPDDEYDRAVWYGFLPEELAELEPENTVVTWNQYCSMLGRAIKLHDAAKEAAEKTIPDYLKAYLKIQPQLNPVIVQVADKYETRLLASFVLHTQSRIERFEAILKNMQSDYQEMYDSIENKPYLLTRVGFSSVVQYRPHFVTMGLFGYHNDVAQISMAIQKSKYDGTEEMFNKWVIHPKEVPAEESEKNAN